MHGITHRQAEVLAFVRDRITHLGIAPTLREIGAALGIGSTNGVQEHLARLQRKGYLRAGSGARNIRLTERGAEYRSMARPVDLEALVDVVVACAKHRSLSCEDVIHCAKVAAFRLAEGEGKS